MLTIEKIRIKGFRGYTIERELEFNKSLVLLYGDNHQGKSSTLNALEWCIYGDKCTGRETKILERVGWEIPNRNIGTKPDVYVEIDLVEKTEGADSVVCTVTRRWISQRKTDVEITYQKGETFSGEEAIQQLANITNNYSFTDFSTAVYQHQEAIRAILIKEPKERNDCIDRLLGLSRYKNILKGIKNANLQKTQKLADSKTEDLKSRVNTIKETREHDIQEKCSESKIAGVKDDQLSIQGALTISNEILKQLRNFAKETNMPISEELVVPTSV